MAEQAPPEGIQGEPYNNADFEPGGRFPGVGQEIERLTSPRPGESVHQPGIITASVAPEIRGETAGGYSEPQPFNDNWPSPDEDGPPMPASPAGAVVTPEVSGRAAQFRERARELQEERPVTAEPDGDQERREPARRDFRMGAYTEGGERTGENGDAYLMDESLRVAGVFNGEVGVRGDGIQVSGAVTSQLIRDRTREFFVVNQGLIVADNFRSGLFPDLGQEISNAVSSIELKPITETSATVVAVNRTEKGFSIPYASVGESAVYIYRQWSGEVRRVSPIIEHAVGRTNIKADYLDRTDLVGTIDAESGDIVILTTGLPAPELIRDIVRKNYDEDPEVIANSVVEKRRSKNEDGTAVVIKLGVEEDSSDILSRLNSPDIRERLEVRDRDYNRALQNIRGGFEEAMVRWENGGLGSIRQLVEQQQVNIHANWNDLSADYREFYIESGMRDQFRSLAMWFSSCNALPGDPMFDRARQAYPNDYPAIEQQFFAMLGETISQRQTPESASGLVYLDRVNFIDQWRRYFIDHPEAGVRIDDTEELWSKYLRRNYQFIELDLEQDHKRREEFIGRNRARSAEDAARYQRGERGFYPNSFADRLVQSRITYSELQQYRQVLTEGDYTAVENELYIQLARLAQNDRLPEGQGINASGFTEDRRWRNELLAEVKRDWDQGQEQSRKVAVDNLQVTLNSLDEFARGHGRLVGKLKKSGTPYLREWVEWREKNELSKRGETGIFIEQRITERVGEYRNQIIGDMVAARIAADPDNEILRRLHGHLGGEEFSRWISELGLRYKNINPNLVAVDPQLQELHKNWAIMVDSLSQLMVNIRPDIPQQGNLISRLLRRGKTEPQQQGLAQPGLIPSEVDETPAEPDSQIGEIPEEGLSEEVRAQRESLNRILTRLEEIRRSGGAETLGDIAQVLSREAQEVSGRYNDRFQFSGNAEALEQEIIDVLIGSRYRPTSEELVSVTGSLSRILMVNDARRITDNYQRRILAIINNPRSRSSFANPAGASWLNDYREGLFKGQEATAGRAGSKLIEGSDEEWQVWMDEANKNTPENREKEEQLRQLETDLRERKFDEAQLPERLVELEMVPSDRVHELLKEYLPFNQYQRVMKQFFELMDEEGRK